MTMKRACLCFLAGLMLFSATAAAAETAGPAVGDMGDGVLRAQLRLNELGYSSSCPAGVWRASDKLALDAFETAGGSWNELFSQNAPRAVSSAAALPDITLTYGGAMPWSEAKTRLSVGTGYLMTDCYTGVMLRVVFRGGEHHALMQPELDWDSATLISLFSGESPFETRPVVLSVDGMLAAASMRLILAKDAAETSVALYFSGSGAEIGGLADADHDASVQIAAGGF